MLNTIKEEALDGGQLSFLGLSIKDERIIEQSRQAYLLSQRLQINRNQDATSDETVPETAGVKIYLGQEGQLF